MNENDARIAKTERSIIKLKKIAAFLQKYLWLFTLALCAINLIILIATPAASVLGEKISWSDLSEVADDHKSVNNAVTWHTILWVVTVAGFGLVVFNYINRKTDKTKVLSIVNSVYGFIFALTCILLLLNHMMFSEETFLGLDSSYYIWVLSLFLSILCDLASSFHFIKKTVEKAEDQLQKEKQFQAEKAKLQAEKERLQSEKQNQTPSEQ